MKTPISMSLLGNKPDDITPDYEKLHSFVPGRISYYKLIAIEKFKLYLFLEDIYTGNYERTEDDKAVTYSICGYPVLILYKDKFRISRMFLDHIENNGQEYMHHLSQYDDVFKDLDDMKNKMGSNFTDAYIYLKDYHMQDKPIPDDLTIFPKDDPLKIFPKDDHVGLLKLPNIPDLVITLMCEITSKSLNSLDSEYIKHYDRTPNVLFYLDPLGNKWDM